MQSICLFIGVGLNGTLWANECRWGGQVHRPVVICDRKIVAKLNRKFHNVAVRSDMMHDLEILEATKGKA